MRAQTTLLVLSGLLSTLTQAHMVPWHPGMYCFGGVKRGYDDKNAYNAVSPLYMLDKSQWWMHHFDKCDEFPPAEGKFLELPAGKSFQVEIAANRGKTSWSFGGKFTTLWGDGNHHPDDYQDSNCISSPLLHTENFNMVAGSTFAISYTSDIKQVTPENLVVFTVNVHSPWKRETTFEVPADLPACPEGGCICAWGWVPNGCGEPNMYQVPYRCKVTGATSTKVVGQAKPAVWCEDDASKCVGGPKQMLYWHQLNGNNIEVNGNDLSGRAKSPAYNPKCGFADGAQNDIFVDGPSSDTPPAEKPSEGSTGAAQNTDNTSGDTPNGNGDTSNSNGDTSNDNDTPAPAPKAPMQRKCLKKRQVPSFRRGMDSRVRRGHAQRNTLRSNFF